MARVAWALAYRPKTLKEFIFQDQSHQALVKKFIEEQNIPNGLLLTGHHGTGKTSLAYLLKKELNIDDMDFLEINASKENSVDMVRTKISNFVSTYPVSEFKIVFLDEADYLTPAAQAPLRNMMETYGETARFILTCNQPNRLIPPLRSRCQELVFKSLDKDDLAAKCAFILKKEGHSVTDAELDIIDGFVDATYPDCRKLINTLQQNFIDGKLVDNAVETASEFVAEFIGLLADGKWNKIRSYVAENVSGDQWDEVYRSMYDYMEELPLFDTPAKQDAGIVVIADHLYKHALVADPEINFAACIIKLSRIATQ